MLGLFRKAQPPAKLRPEGRVAPVGQRAPGGSPRLPAAIRAEVQPGFPEVDGPHYLDVLAELHAILAPDWYLEIGTSRGHSLRLCPGNFVAIDPAFEVSDFAMGQMRQGHFLQMTSDEAFASDFLARNGIAPKLGFLDGMHRFEYLLRDVMNFEKCAAPGAVAVLHDCLPFNAAMTARDWDREALRFWTGDVWKTLAILEETRPDLGIHVLDAYPTGLVVLTGLDPENRVLDAAYEECVARHLDLDIEAYGAERYFGARAIESSHGFVTSLRAGTAQTRPEKGA
ncbi:class I SAM-dependent methyltransferase [Roseivivax sp. CAU 1761]